MPHLPKKQPRRAYTVRKRSKAEYGNEAGRFYNSTAWRKLSRRYRDNNPLCEVCNEKPAQVTDHIIRIVADERGYPLPTGGAAWDERNHMAMCHSCHNRKRGKERHGFVVDSVRTENGLIPKDRWDIINILRDGSK